VLGAPKYIGQSCTNAAVTVGCLPADLRALHRSCTLLVLEAGPQSNPARKQNNVAGASLVAGMCPIEGLHPML
jgi:hypothetical protein